NGAAVADRARDRCILLIVRHRSPPLSDCSQVRHRGYGGGLSPDIGYSPESRWREPQGRRVPLCPRPLVNYSNTIFTGTRRRRSLSGGAMRYFFHIVDKYGLFPDRIGVEHADQGSAVRHARNIAAELAKAGELFRSSIVFVSRDGAFKP